MLAGARAVLNGPVGVGALVVGALGLRVFAWMRTDAIFSDGPTFLALARLISAGEWQAALSHAFHPLYPAAIAGAHACLTLFGVGGEGSWETAGVAVSALAGAASVGLLFAWLCSAFDRNTAWIGAALLAFHPRAVAFSADVQSEGLYLALFLAAVWLLDRGLRGTRASSALVAGGFCGLAYLVRPEGLSVLLIGCAFAGARAVNGRWTRVGALGWSTALAAGVVLVAAPYVVTLRAQTGVWTLTQKKSLGEFVGLESTRPFSAAGLDADAEARLVAEHPFLETVLHGPRSAPTTTAVPSDLPPLDAGPPRPWRHASAGYELQKALSDAAGPGLCVLLALGVFARRGRPGDTGRLVLGFVAVHGLLLYGLAYAHGYVSKRHVLPLVALAMGYAALGVPVLGRLLLLGFARLRRQAAEVAWQPAAALGLALTFAMAAPKTFEVHRGERLAERRAAEWLRGQPTTAVAGWRQRVAYYADAPYVQLRILGKTELLRYLRGSGVSHVVVAEDRLSHDPALSAAAGSSLELLHRTLEAGRTALVYAVKPTDVVATRRGG